MGVKMNLIRYLKSFYRRGRYGWDYSDCFSMDVYLSKTILQMLKHLETKPTYPSEFNSIEEWHDILLEIAEGFKRYTDFEDYWDFSKNNKETIKEFRKIKKELRKSLNMFSKYFLHLWW